MACFCSPKINCFPKTCYFSYKSNVKGSIWDIVKEEAVDILGSKHLVGYLYLVIIVSIVIVVIMVIVITKKVTGVKEFSFLVTGDFKSCFAIVNTNYSLVMHNFDFGKVMLLFLTDVLINWLIFGKDFIFDITLVIYQGFVDFDWDLSLKVILISQYFVMINSYDLKTKRFAKEV